MATALQRKYLSFLSQLWPIYFAFCLKIKLLPACEWEGQTTIVEASLISALTATGEKKNHRQIFQTSTYDG